MRHSAMAKNLRQSILKSLGRYLAIAAIIALGGSMFVGLVTTKTDMVATGQKYMDAQNMFDLRLISSMGWAEDQLQEISLLDGIEQAEGIKYSDVITRRDEGTQESVMRFYAIPHTLDRLSLHAGRMPESPDECLVDNFRIGGLGIGTRITIADSNSDSAKETMKFTTYTVVGTAASPLYMDMNRGTTSVGNGSISGCVFIPEDGFDMDYYSEIHVTIPGSYKVYTEEYNDAMSEAAQALEPLLEPFAQARLEQVKAEGEEAYRDGIAEYEQGLADYKEGEETARRELEEAHRKLLDGQQEIADGEAALEDGKRLIAEGYETLRNAEQEIADGWAAYAQGKADAQKKLEDGKRQLEENQKTIEENLPKVNDGIAQIEAGLPELNAGISKLESGIGQLDQLLQPTKTALDAARIALQTAKLLSPPGSASIAQAEANLNALIATHSKYQAQRDQYAAQLNELYQTRSNLNAQLNELYATRQQMQDGLIQIEQGYAALESGKVQMQQELTAAEAKLYDGENQLEQGRRELADKERELADGVRELEQGKQELADGWKEYEQAKLDVRQELEDAQKKLDDAASELADARETLDGMTKNSAFVLDRNTNIGYNSLDSNSDIVAGVSRVFPIFFLLVAALVCITTMTRMIDEERTQIGTLKALGYENREIIRKYLLYSGSGAVLGCGIGVALGSVVFPTILWEAYKIILNITPRVTFKVDWLLCFAVVIVYTLAMMLVTWYCCKRSLEERPAELIRPKVLSGGKKLIFEKLPIWNRLSFLNKVSIRNIFRYRQRLAMMLVGIGGCTALLLTGFGIRDSIVNIVGIQFDEVMNYDISVNFSGGRSDAEKEAFLSKTSEYASDVLFYYQTSMELDGQNGTHSVNVVMATDRLQEFENFRRSGHTLSMPGQGEVLLSVGVAESLNVHRGDTVRLRNADMEVLELTVSGIYENHVYNYAIISPETVQSQWNRIPADQTAMVKVADGQDPHAVGAKITKLSGVINITVNRDMANSVSSMMKAMDYVVLLVVFCAALLAVIVVYNLTNINITERIREIATIKVLGFRSGETAAYVFKENLALSVMGALVGLPAGKLLLAFVISQIKIDMVWFSPRASLTSYLLSVVLTLVSTCLVNFIFYFKMEKINMAEALKSVE